jgi:membrane-bound lytic murein transglycosylase MltF
MLTAVACGWGCAGPEQPATPPTPAPAPAAAPSGAPAASPSETVSPYDALPEAIRDLLDRPFTGDLPEMMERRLIRAGVVFNRTQYFIDRGVQRGMAYESLRLFEQELNEQSKTGKLTVQVAFVPLPRDQLFPALADGKVDLVAAAITVTPERQKLAAFTTPTRTGVSEVVVTSAAVAPVATVNDLSGREVFVRRTSSYFESLARLNSDLARRGSAPVAIKEAPEALEDDDILEMVNAGLVDVTVVDDFVAGLWQQVFPKIRVNPDATLRTQGTIAVAVRKDSRELTRALNAWIARHGLGTTFGNVLDRRYIQNAAYVKSATSRAERAKFEQLVNLFRKYGDRYDIDPLLMAAQGYQESGLDHRVKSPVGAIGVMQVMPKTGEDLKVGDITQLEPNIHAGVKYVRFVMDQHFKDDPADRLNKGLMTLASYNAGPARVRQLRQEAARRGLDPNVWFGNVERIASERIGRETVQYVSNIYKYYVAYRLTVERAENRRRLRDQPGGRAGQPVR